MQSFTFEMEVRLALHPERETDCAGIGMMGYTYHYLALFPGELRLIQGLAETHSRHVPTAVQEHVLESRPYAGSEVHLKLRVADGRVRFFGSADGNVFEPFGDELPLSPGGWTGARPGLFAMSREVSGGYADFAYCRFTNL